MINENLLKFCTKNLFNTSVQLTIDIFSISNFILIYSNFFIFVTFFFVLYQIIV